MKHEPMCLGDKLAPTEHQQTRSGFVARMRYMFYTALNFLLLTAISVVLLWWFLLRPDIDRVFILVFLAALGAAWVVVSRGRLAVRTGETANDLAIHPLLANDRQGFMYDLRLDAKTAVFDGSNIYHFGCKNGLGTQPLGRLANQLRDEGYRIVCFFDANIFYTLSEHGAFASDQRHSVAMLKDIFGLRTDEIYVVPGGVQADEYVLDSLKYLPISFAVTNDQFRDYATKYPTVMQGEQWRKGVAISRNEIKLQQHRFQSPVLLKSLKV